jgi:Tripartite tricarboxylate transporter family receptor
VAADGAGAAAGSSGELPTLSEFVPGYEACGFTGITAPKNTPPEIIEKLNREIIAAFDDPTIKARFAEWGATPLPGSPTDFGRFFAEIENPGRWSSSPAPRRNDRRRPVGIKLAKTLPQGSTSSVGQSRLAHPINIMFKVLGVPVDACTFRTFNCKTRIEPQHLRSCGSRLLKLSRLGIGAR